jgi:hypothetical protein
MYLAYYYQFILTIHFTFTRLVLVFVGNHSAKKRGEREPE